MMNYITETVKTENFKTIVNLELKKSKAEISLAFNQTCLNNNLLPTYTKLRLHDTALQDKSEI